MGGRSWAHRGPRSSQLLDRTERWARAASQQGPLPPGSQGEPFSTQTQGPQIPAGKALFLQDDP